LALRQLFQHLQLPSQSPRQTEGCLHARRA
jgi:hypothetical protein